MHTKQLGTIGELKVASKFVEAGHTIFKEFGDLSKTDLIVLLDDKVPIKVQAKSYATKKGVMHFSIEKAGPNYRFKYSPDQVDLFVVYVPDKDEVVYITWKDLATNTTTLNLRFDQAKNNQQKNVVWAKDFLSLDNALSKLNLGPVA